jgi:Na+/H+ antiporter NhaD/arsenite permease-like protein
MQRWTSRSSGSSARRARPRHEPRGRERRLHAHLPAARLAALLGFVSTVAGNLTLLGSVAHVIVAERARQHHELGFLEYLRFGAASTLLVLAVGVPIVCLLT